MTKPAEQDQVPSSELVAQAGPAQRVTASLVQFDGSASSDPDGDSLIRYEWDFGNGTTGSGVRPSHVYASPGTYEVRLTVTDSAGVPHNSDSSTVQIVVNARPIADAGPELVGAPGQTLTFDGSRSVDPDGTIAEYSWDFRDGTTASGQTVSHAFAAPGVHNRPFLLDMATSTAAIGKLRVKLFNGEQVPAGWAFDDEGNWETDPEPALADPKLSPLGGDEEHGGHKGYGLAAMVEILSTTLAGATFAPLRPEQQATHGVGHFFLAIDPAFFRALPAEIFTP